MTRAVKSVVKCECWLTQHVTSELIRGPDHPNVACLGKWMALCPAAPENVMFLDWFNVTMSRPLG